MNMGLTKSGVIGIVESWRLWDRGYQELSGASQQGVDLWMDDRISSKDLTHEAKCFLYAKGHLNNCVDSIED